jgi:hypothetical protein
MIGRRLGNHSWGAGRTGGKRRAGYLRGMQPRDMWREQAIWEGNPVAVAERRAASSMQGRKSGRSGLISVLDIVF